MTVNLIPPLVILLTTSILLFFFVFLPAMKCWLRVRKLQVGVVYARDGKNPYEPGKAIIRDMAQGYVKYSYFGDNGHPSEYTHSMRTKDFAWSYREFTNPPRPDAGND